MQINNETLRAFRSALIDTVKPLEEKYGVKIEMGNITYSSDSFHFKVNVQNRLVFMAGLFFCKFPP